jgi:hypothetical protein
VYQKVDNNQGKLLIKPLFSALLYKNLDKFGKFAIQVDRKIKSIYDQFQDNWK